MFPTEEFGEKAEYSGLIVKSGTFAQILSISRLVMNIFMLQVQQNRRVLSVTMELVILYFTSFLTMTALGFLQLILSMH